jgi:hypothetical protein
MLASPLSAQAAITFIGQAANDTASATLPPLVQPGDVAVVFAYRAGSNSVPTLPSGWTSIDSGGANTNSAIIGYRVLQSGDTTTGTWTNATEVGVQVYRGLDTLDPIGKEAKGGASSATITYPAITMQQTDGTSWVLGFAGDRNIAANVATAPAGMTNHISVASTTANGGAAGGADTNGGVTSWSSETVASGVSATGYRTFSLEIFQAPASAPTITTGSVSPVYSGSATLGGSVTATGGGSGTMNPIGFAYSTNSTLSTGVSTTTGSQTGTGSFSGTITGLSPSTTYYYRAYATNATGTGYGSIQSFTTTATLSCDFGSDDGAGGCRGFLTTTGSNQTFTSPSDWNNSANTIECIGAGGSGGTFVQTSSARGDGGGGGAYAIINNFTFALPGITTATYQVGIGGSSVSLVGGGASPGNAGGNSWFNNSSYPGAGSDNSQCAAQGGSAGGTSGVNAAGGAAGSSWGQTAFSGGQGGAATASNSAAGGGGAAGNVTTGGAGTNASSAGATAGGQANGTGASGGAGATGSNSTSITGGTGGSGTEYGTAGSGGGGGGGRNTSTTNGAQAIGGSGGAYGGGGGGAVESGAKDATSGAGGNGLIVITYTPAVPTASCTLSASPSSIATNGASKLTWTSTNATSTTINNSVGPVSPVAGGSVLVAPTQTTTYTMTVTGLNQTNTCSATVSFVPVRILRLRGGVRLLGGVRLE